MNNRSEQLKALGFEPHHTGGGCMALRLEHPETKRYLLVTHFDDPSIPNDNEPCMVGEYSPDGDMNTNADLFGGTEGEIFPPEATDVLVERVEDWLRGGPENLLSRLSDLLQLYCDLNGLPQMSADELANQLRDEPQTPAIVRQVRWLECFSDLWEATNV